MPDLIFHIGLGKCASTTLQRKVLCTDPGYLGTGVDLGVPENFAKRFQALAPVGARLRGNLPAARAWADRVLEYGCTQHPDIDRYIVSSEGLSGRNRFQARPIIHFLRRFADEIWAAGKVKTLIVLRNPAERMASNYAQGASSTFGASQADFERHVEQQLTSRRPALDLGAWVDELYRELGQENVCVLLMEDIATLRFWTELKEFMQLEAFEPGSMLRADGMNTRKTLPNTWRLAPFDAMARANAQSVKLLGLVWPAGRFHGTRKTTQKVLRNTLAGFHSINPKKRLERRRESQIKLTDELRQRIRNHYRPSHELLSKLLDRDLAPLGY